MRRDYKNLLAMELSCAFVAFGYYLINHAKTDFKAEVKFTGLDEVLLWSFIIVVLVFPVLFLAVYQFYKKELEVKT